MSALSSMVLLPLLIGGLLTLGYLRGWARGLSVLSVLWVGFQVKSVWQGFQLNSASMQLREFRPLFGSVGFSWNLGVDGWNILPLAVVAIVLFAAVLAGRDDDRFESGWLLLVGGAALGALMSLNLGLLLLFLLVLIAAIGSALLDTQDQRQGAAIGQWLGSATVVLLAVLALIVGLTMGAGQGDSSLNYSTMLRRNFALGEARWLFGFTLVAIAVLAGWAPFATWRRIPSERLSAPLVGLIQCAGGAIALVLTARLLLPMYEDLVVMYAPALVILGLLWATYDSLAAWVRDDWRSQLQHLAGAMTALAFVGMFSLQTRGAVGGLMLAMGFYLAWFTCLVLVHWLERAWGAPADWWSVRAMAQRSPSFRFYAMIGLAGLAVMPLSAAFVGELLLINDVADRAIKAVQAHKDYDGLWLAAGHLIPLLAAVGVAFRYLWLIGQRRDGDIDYMLAPRIREAIVLLTCLGFVFYWGLRPQSVSNRLDSAISFTFEKRLSDKQPVRAPVYEIVPDSDADMPER